jgi:long-subunit acyl-CoA synthetase (AMP-forming)
MPPGWEVKLSEDEPNRGEILVRSADLFDGYWGNPAATREIKGDDGWLRTGDIGEWVEVGADHHPAASGGTPPQRGGEKDSTPPFQGGVAGEARRGGSASADHHPGRSASTPPQRGGEKTDAARELRLIDRARDFIVTSGGKSLSPAFIENLLRASPYVAEAMVIGHGKKYLTALIEIDFDAVSDWARSHNVAYTGFTSLAENPEVCQLLEREVARANAELARVEQLKAFRILPKALDPEEEGEPVTPTRKVKRTLMIERFRELVDAMYDDSEERLLAAGAGNVVGRE